MLKVSSLLRVASPAYFFRPWQIIRRLAHEYRRKSRGRITVMLPWRLPLNVNPNEAIGYNLSCRGLYELGVTEALWSLTERGDLAIDAGANIGYMSSLLMRRVGSSGYVIAFEPHPSVYAELAENSALWEKDPFEHGCFKPSEAALGEKCEKSTLWSTDWFLTNRGTASLVNKDPGAATCRVVKMSLDSLSLPLPTIGVLKIDVEGAQLSVLQGAERLLNAKSIRDIVFEEMEGYPATSHHFLESKGYSIFFIQENFLGIRLLSTGSGAGKQWSSELPNFLATIEPERAMQRLDGRFWRSFGPLCRVKRST